MPIYEYHCPDCGLQKEFIQKVADAPVAACPACGSGGFSKMLSAAGFQLKGSGWYATDFKGATIVKEKEKESESKSADSTPVTTPCGGSCSCH